MVVMGFLLTLIIASLSSGQVVKETSKVEFDTEAHCAQVGEQIKDNLTFQAMKMGFALTVQYKCA